MMVPVSLLILLYNFSLVPHSDNDGTAYVPSFTDLFANLPHAFGSILIGGTIIGCVFLFVRFAIAPALKVLADIFRYVGDPNYRAAIQDGIDRCFDGLGLAGKEFYLVGHSLGSVIAVDALWRTASPLVRCSSITLITLGSPLRRFFWQFFRPAMPSAGDLSACFDSRYQRFQWINVYRPFDPIGTRLFDSRGRDFSTRQYHRVLAWAHTNYWSDRNVLGGVRQALTRPTGSLTGAPIARDITLFQGVGFQNFPLAAQRAIAALWVALPVVALCASRFYFNTDFELVEFAVKTAKIDRNAGESPVRVWDRPYQTTTIQGIPTTKTEYLISYDATDGVNSFVIDRSLAEALKEAKYGLPRARYSLDHPTEYYLPHYEQPAWPSIWGWAWQVFCWGFVSAAWVKITAGAIGSLASMTLGLYRPPFRDRSRQAGTTE